jgi:hypothetical protein
MALRRHSLYSTYTGERRRAFRERIGRSMAGTDGAEKRIGFLLGLPIAGTHGERVRPRYSPAPLNGGPNLVHSYGLLILYRAGADVLLIQERSSLTTNRHIQAGARVLERNGYAATGERRQRAGHDYAVYAKTPA